MNKKDYLVKLFQWAHKLEIKDKDNEVVGVIYQRLVGDAALQQARLTALRYSRAMRNTLKDKTSDQYLVNIAPIYDLNKEECVITILSEGIFDLRQQIERDFYFPEDVEPDSDASTEKFEEFAEKFESWEDRRKAKLNQELSAKINEQKTELETKSHEELLEIVSQTRINYLCESELKIKFMECCTYLGTYLDEKYSHKLFDDFEEFLDQSDYLKSQLVDGYSSLEMSSISLKGSTKSQPSEPSSASQLKQDSQSTNP